MPSAPRLSWPTRALLLACALGALGYALWQPGTVRTDGRHDRRAHAAWLQHGWLGDDGWFADDARKHTDRRPLFRSPERIAQAAARLRQAHVADVFPHLCPARADGSIAPADEAQVERFLDGFQGFRVLPWVGGIYGESARVGDPAWRAGFAASVRGLLERHPRLAGVHVNIEPCPSGDADYLATLDAVRAALPPGKLLSVAAYPPPTLLQRSLEVHWDQAYFRAVAQRADQLAVMLYDTSLRQPKLYQAVLRDWVGEVLAWSAPKPVLLGLPAYDDAGVGYHDPEVENLAVALPGAHAGLERAGEPANYQGAALYAEWTLTEAQWAAWREGMLAPSR